MKGKSPNQNQLSLVDQSLPRQLNPKHPLYRLAKAIPWDELEQELAPLYSHTGRKAHPVRLMVGLLILKQLRNLSDEAVVEQWVESGYFQYFCGEAYFQWNFPCHPTDLVLFRKRIGEKGIERILQISIELHGGKATEREVLIDSTVQEKNITFPTDTKLHHKIAKRCVSIAEETGIQLRQSYKRTIKDLLLAQRFRNHPKNFKKANRAAKKLKTIAGRLVRDVERKLPAHLASAYGNELALFHRVLKVSVNQTPVGCSGSANCSFPRFIGSSFL